MALKFKIILLGTESSSSQNTGIHAIANETRAHGLETFCIDYVEHYSEIELLELADRLNKVTCNKPIIGVNTNFAYESKNFLKLISLLKPHCLVAGGVNRLFDWNNQEFIDYRGTSRETDFVKFCYNYFNIIKDPQHFSIENLKHYLCEAILSCLNYYPTLSPPMR